MRREIACLLTLACLMYFERPALGAPWVSEGTLHGVAVTSRAVAGQEMPEFRGEAVVRAGLFEIMAVINDAERHCEWMARCVESRVVRNLKGADRILYQRLDAPWPVADRDLLVRSSVKVDLSRNEVVSSFRAVKHRAQPLVADTVRIEDLKGFYRLTAIDENRTRVVYQALSDPGGSIPKWLAKKASVRIPADTISALRTQVKRTKGEYKGFEKRFMSETP